MFRLLQDVFQIDWRIFMAGADAWMQGKNPYGELAGGEFSAGAFAYPPTALPWLALFTPLGGAGYYIWTLLQLLLWWWIARRHAPWHLILLLWFPVVLGLIEGQSTLPVVLVLWAATLAPRRGWLWGLALAWCMTKPQVALLPILWLLWQDRRAPTLWPMLGGMVGGTLVLAIPPTLRDPGIWNDWIVSLGSYRGRILQMASWQGAGVVVVALAGGLWWRSKAGGWQWWLSAALFPHTSFYSIVAALPALRPTHNYWTLGGLALAGVLLGPMTPVSLPLILAGHMLALWMINGGTAQTKRLASGVEQPASVPASPQQSAS